MRPSFDIAIIPIIDTSYKTQTPFSLVLPKSVINIDLDPTFHQTYRTSKHLEHPLFNPYPAPIDPPPLSVLTFPPGRIPRWSFPLVDLSLGIILLTQPGADAYFFHPSVALPEAPERIWLGLGIKMDHT